MSNFAVLPPEFGEDNPVHPPRSARNTRGNHKYDPTVVNNKAVGYVRVQYEHQAFPVMVYHPKFGLEPKPELAKFAIGCVTAEQYQSANTAYMKAEEKWARGNRTKIAESEAHLEALVKKGWLEKPPARTESKQFDMSSDEI